jgi:tRNA nucleotidyltransferase (CCA-adding enzyme)
VSEVPTPEGEAPKPAGGTPTPSGAADGGVVLRALAMQPGGPQLLAIGRERDDLALVGGAVRDLLLGHAPRELDVVVAGDAGALASELAAVIGASVTTHERFGTAAVEWEAGRVDVAARRAESYAAPGALPEVREGSLEEDLQRRDFTVNALAVALGGPYRGELASAEHALEDLASGRLRVLHEQSFVDDPTRLLRLARYQARLGFEAEPRTAELAGKALAAGALSTVSRARIGAELRLALAEADAIGSLAGLDRLGVLRAIDPELSFDEALVRRALTLLPEDGRADLLLMASLLLALAAREENPELELFELLDGLEFTAGERDRVTQSALAATSLAEQLALPMRPSQLHTALRSQTLEAVALAGALAGDGSPAGAPAADWLARVRHVRLTITGDDLLAAGVQSGPQLGMRLQAALGRKLDGELEAGPQAELAAALEASI